MYSLPVPPEQFRLEIVAVKEGLGNQQVAPRQKLGYHQSQLGLLEGVPETQPSGLVTSWRGCGTVSGLPAPKAPEP